MNRLASLVLLTVLFQLGAASMRAQQPTTGQHDESTGQRELESQIVALEKRLWNGDVSKLEADDYEAIKHAHRYHRADDEAAAKEAKFALVSMDDIRVRMLRPDVALMTYHATEKGSFRGTDVPPSLYFGSIWVNRRGEWKNVFLEENLPDAFTETYMPASGAKGGSVLRNASDQSATDDTKELLQIESDLLNAYVHRDLSVRDRYVAEEFVGVDSSGSVYSKQQDMQELKDGTFSMKLSRLADVRVRLFGDSAMVTGRNTATSVYKGKEETYTIRFADTFLKRDGRWQMVYSQDTTVAADTTATTGEPAVLKAIVANDENQIIALEKRLWNSDANEISKLEAEDYEVIKHAHRYHRADDEAAAKDVKFALTSMDDIRVRMLRPDVALITYHATQKGSFRGTEVPPSLYFGSIWVNRSGDWKNVFLEENAPDVFTDIYKPSAD